LDTLVTRLYDAVVYPEHIQLFGCLIYQLFPVGKE